MVKALADRLAEAFAEWLHAEVRHAWYAPDEAALERGAGRGALPRDPAGVRLPRLPGPQREGEALRPARRGRRGARADRDLRDDARRERQRHLLRAPGGAVLLGRPHRARPGRGLRRAEGHRARRRPSAGCARISPTSRRALRMMRRVKGVVVAVLALALSRARRARRERRPAEEDHRRPARRRPSAALAPAADFAAGWKATAAHEADDQSRPAVLVLQPGPVRPGRDRQLRLARLRPARTARRLRLDRRLQDRRDGEDGVRARCPAARSRSASASCSRRAQAPKTTIFSAAPLAVPERTATARTPTGSSRR